ncbi:Transient receptor potential cation channel subfamily A member 1-like 2 [Homarus americanus]|uniref:Transient receptor potential cation channel subfamily A member 1-like 2 n=1 Tax=Homarus americanus TaxID=6706 RepID=A0A8J5MQH3_HOMAM|nr:Transient receptor potential cation channel subfamily A member 1-like 2 [Homarus americanus]
MPQSTKPGCQQASPLPYIYVPMDTTDAKPNSGRKTLRESVSQKDFHLCQKLLNEGESVTYKDEDGSSLLHILAKKYSKRETRAQNIPSLLLQYGAEINVKDKNGDAPLHIAAREGLKDLCIILVEHQKVNSMNPKVNIKNKKSMTPLHYAAYQGELQIVKLLIKEGADPCARDHMRYLPLHHAADRGHHECCKELAPFYVGDTVQGQEISPPVMLAAMKGHYRCFKEMVHVHAKMNLNFRNAAGNTPLHMVARSGFEKFAALLIETGAALDIQNNVGNTPLMEAVLRNKISCLSVLMEKEANVNIKNNSQSGVLHVAATKKAEECMEYLLKHEEVKKELNEKDKDGYTALFIAVRKHSEKCAVLLLAAGASTSIVCQQKLSLLHLAADNVRPTLLEKLLMIRTLDVNVKNIDNETPLHVVARGGSREGCQLLLRKGAHIDAADKNGRTALQLSAYQGHSSVVRLLIKYGANKRAKDDNNTTALHAAAAKGNLECCEILSDADKALYKLQDRKKRYALDIAFLKGHDKVFQFLLNILPYKNINTMPQDLQDHLHSYTHKALKGRKKTVVETIVRSQWWEAGFGVVKKHEDVPCTNFRELIKLYPFLAQVVMDHCTSVTEKCTLYDFRLLEDNYCIKEDKNILRSSVKSPFNQQTWEVLPAAKELTSKVLVWKKEHPVSIMAHHRCLGLLQHPLTEAWISFKWKSYARWIFAGLLVLRLFAVGVLIGFMATIHNWEQVKKYSNKSKEVFCGVLETSHDTVNAAEEMMTPEFTGRLQWNSTVYYTWHVLLLVSLILQLQWDYVDSTFIFVRIPSLVLTTIVCIPSCKCGFQLGIKMVPIWQCGILALLMAWVQLIQIINKLPQLSIFTISTWDFIKCYLKGLMYIGMVIILFAFIFFMLLRDQLAFKTVPQSIIKTVVWMLGDLNYDETFVGENKLSYPVLVNVLFLIFMCTVWVFIVTLIKTPSSDEREVALYRKAGRANLILNLDVLFPSLRRKYAIGKYNNMYKRPWLVKKIQNFQRPSSWMSRTLALSFNMVALMDLDELKKDDNNDQVLSKFEEFFQLFKKKVDGTANLSLPDPQQDHLEAQTRKLDQLLTLFNQLNDNYQKQNEQMIELKQQLDNMKQKSRHSVHIP